MDRFFRANRASRLDVLGVDVREDARTVRSFVIDKRLAYRILLDQDAAVAARYQVRGIPTVLLVDRSGKVIYRGYEMPPVSLLKPLL